jgi:hypothetical protein
MDLDLTQLSEGDLIDLNRRIIERLQLLRSAKSLAQLAHFSVGMAVIFEVLSGHTTPSDGGTGYSDPEDVSAPINRFVMYP